MTDHLAPFRAEVATFSSFTFSYLSRALVWVKTLRAAHPGWVVYACMVDAPPPGIDISDLLGQFDHVVYSVELGIPNYRGWMFKHDIVEACTAVKGDMLNHLLNLGYDKVIYFDPDIALFHPLDDLVEQLSHCSVILTPHQASPNQNNASFRDNELTSMRYGIYNLGFVAVRNTESGREFAQWWSERLREACYDDVESGIFTDQKYCDLVPGLFSGVEISRDPGCNFASWNLSTRKLRMTDDGQLHVNGSTLKFYHFTKINSEGDAMTDKYAGANTEVIEVWNWYKRALDDAMVPELPNRYWTYASFSNGRKISKAARVLFRQRADLMAYFKDPFDAEGDSYYGWLLRESSEIFG